MIHLNEKTRQLPDTGMTFPFPTTNILMYLSGQNETITYDYDPTCCTFSNTTGATSNYTYDPGNSSINTGKSSSFYDYDNICGLHPCESRSTDKATYVDSNLYYYGYRYYCPELGRWVSRDSIGEWGGFNIYVFVVNDPVVRGDSLGQFGSYDRPKESGCSCSGKLTQGQKECYLYSCDSGDSLVVCYVNGKEVSRKEYKQNPPAPPKPAPPDSDDWFDFCVETYKEGISDEAKDALWECVKKALKDPEKLKECIESKPIDLSEDAYTFVGCCYIYKGDFSKDDIPPKEGTQTECYFGNCKCIFGLPWRGLKANSSLYQCRCQLTACVAEARKL